MHLCPNISCNLNTCRNCIPTPRKLGHTGRSRLAGLKYQTKRTYISGPLPRCLFPWIVVFLKFLTFSSAASATPVPLFLSSFLFDSPTDMPSLESYDILLDLSNDMHDPVSIQLLRDYGRTSSPIILLDPTETLTLILESGTSYQYAVKLHAKVANVT